jgi:Na+/melibiose symporter-like transporter
VASVAAPRAGWRTVGPTVWLLGVTSLLTDVSSEMLTSIFPLYLVFHLGLSPLSFGVVDGLHHGGAAAIRVVAGVLADRWRASKLVALAGYLASALSKLGLYAVGAHASGLAAFTLLDRAGKGIRTAPRDAMIARSVPAAVVGTAFGVHRALDTTGAVLGPLVAFGVLHALPGAYDAVFVVSFAFAIVGVGVLLTFVREPGERDGGPAPTLVQVSHLLREPRVRRLLACLLLLGLFTLSDGFLYLALQRRLGFEERHLPLLFVATPAAYFLLAIPAGRLADRVGRGRVVLYGYALLACVYLVVLLSPATGGATSLVLAVALLGGYYAATDGVMMALASTTLPRELLASGLGLVATANGFGRLLGSLAFGLLFSVLEPRLALLPFALALPLAVVAARALLAERKGPALGG